MFCIEKAVVVEGKYDKIKLESILSAEIITTDGFGIFKDKEKLNLIRKIADKKGIVILTDSDSAGQMIRTYLCKYIEPSKIAHAYIPEILGKEKRKQKPSAEGTLGVEGVKTEVLISALERAGVFGETVKKPPRKVTKADLYNYGYSGALNSSEKRRQLLKKLELPSNMSTNGLLTAVNALYSYDDFLNIIKGE